jgi:hypothetical protein
MLEGRCPQCFDQFSTELSQMQDNPGVGSCAPERLAASS